MYTYKEQLQQQIDLLDYYTNKVVAVKEQNIQKLEQKEALETLDLKGPSKGLALQLSPSTQGAFKGFPLDYQNSLDLRSITQVTSINL